MVKQATLVKPAQDRQALTTRLSVAEVSSLVAAASHYTVNRQYLTDLQARYGVRDHAAAKRMVSELRFSVALNYYAAPHRLESLKHAGDALATLHGFQPVTWPRPNAFRIGPASGATD